MAKNPAFSTAAQLAAFSGIWNTGLPLTSNSQDNWSRPSVRFFAFAKLAPLPNRRERAPSASGLPSSMRISSSDISVPFESVAFAAAAITTGSSCRDTETICPDRLASYALLPVAGNSGFPASLSPDGLRSGLSPDGFLSAAPVPGRQRSVPLTQGIQKRLASPSSSTNQ